LLSISPPFTDDLEDEVPPQYAGDRSRAAMKSLRAAARKSRRRTARILVASYLSYAALSLFLPGVVAQRVAGPFTVGLLVGCAQIAVVAVIALRYAAEMERRVDPLADAVRGAAHHVLAAGDDEEESAR
jgi:uncharacterized membrane protein (DUF485 family)